jgi:hypothetical protein
MKAIVLSTFGLLMLASVCTAQSRLAKANPAKRSIRTTKTEVSQPNYPIIQATPAMDAEKQRKAVIANFREANPNVKLISRRKYESLDSKDKAKLSQRSIFIYEGDKPTAQEIKSFK